MLDRQQRVFKGTVTIIGTGQEDTTAITLHAKDLHIISASLDGKAAEWETNDYDALSITHPDYRPGKHITVITFTGAITDGMHGLYPCYFDHDGTPKELLATQFESHHAREVFPCVDEPSAKATFDVTLTTETAVAVLGNMPIKQQDDENGLLVTRFETTPRMSTYLLAWVVGDMQRKSAHTKDGVEVSVWATPVQSTASLEFALEFAVKTIEFYNDFFGIPYPLPKSDHVALPDFSSGAMENWGLITYREIALLADPATTSIEQRQYVATVIAHELAHQWFGNLVTMAWWNDLWLNESFATLMEYIAVDAIKPDWDIWFDFSQQETVSALRRDALEGVQPVQIDVNHPDEISTLFDGSIVYAKGARLLKMLREYIGEQNFTEGLRRYFTTHAYGNTVANDLWESLHAASHIDVSTFMNTWLGQSGYPVIHVNKTPAGLELAQEQFFIGPHEPSKKQWPIPLGSPLQGVPPLMTEQILTIPTDSDNVTSYMFNQHDSAHFITHLSVPLLEKKLAALDTLPPLTRLQLVHEQTLLAQGNIIPSATLIPVLQAYSSETKEPVWNMLSLALGELKKFVEDDPDAEAKLRSLSGRLAKLLYDHLGWEPIKDEPDHDIRLRSIILGMMLYSEDADVLTKAQAIYAETAFDKLVPELRGLVLGAVVRHAETPELIDALLERYRKESSSEVRNDIAAGITSTRQESTAARILDIVKEGKLIRPQDATHWIIWLLRNRYSRHLVWSWIRQNWDWIKKTFAGDMSYDLFPRYIAGSLRTDRQYKEYKSFFSPMKDDTVLKRNIEIGLTDIQGRIALLERDTPGVTGALLNLDD
ncbi:MAG: putative Aminopeptidase [Candidatus Saccharibacteria bacterium]|nr:putative Aminopeptidase [Candidatus Saccharibacteria bacterium]